MTGPSSTPRGARPSTRWETVLTSIEVVVPYEARDDRLPKPDRATDEE